MTNLAARLHELARERGGRTFCTFLARGACEDITFAQLYERSAAYAAQMQERGVGPGDVVIVILEHTPHLFYAFLGAVLAGATPSFMPFRTPKQRAELYWDDHRRLFERIGPALVVTYESNAAAARESLPGNAIPFLIASDDVLVCAPPARPFAGLNAAMDATACLQHSSGTTGLKKGVMLTHEAIARQVDAYARAIGLDESDRIASWLPLYHDMGFVACFLTALLRGIMLVALDPFEWVVRPRLLLDAIETYAATLCWLPNFAFAHLVNTARPADRWDLSSMRAFVNCSEPCKPRAFERFLERFSSCGVDRGKLQVCYALAENVFAATQTPPGSAVRAAGSVLSCGRPISGVEIVIRGPEGRAVPSGTVGEIAISSPFLFSGYHRLPQATARALKDGWYASGDLGFFKDGELYVTGRVDDLLTVNGRNFYAHEFEEIASTVPGCIPGRAVALSEDNAADGTRELVILIEVTEGHDGAVVGGSVKAAILERLGIAVNRVRAFARGTLIKTTSGKISRSENRRFLAGAKLAECEPLRP